MDLVPDTNMLHVNLPTAGSFVADDAVSTCPLLTPSPPTNALVDSTIESQEPSYIVPSDELATKLQQVGEEPNIADSTSSNSSTTAEPACVQLLNHHHYHHLSKNLEDGSIQENGIKQPSLQLSCNKTAEDYCFVTWNWPLIRKSCMWIFISALVGCLGLVIAMVATLPRTCNPSVEWYQGSLMYEVFPASFQDSNGDGIGDLKGLASRSDYFSALGIRCVRLNSIFSSHHYPEGYHNVTSLMKIDHSLGSLKDFNSLVNALHSKNISLILDIPTWPLVKQLGINTRLQHTVNLSNLNEVAEYLKTSDYFEVDPEEDQVADAISYWIDHGVDGFYIKGLKHYLSNDYFGEAIKNWKKIIGYNRPFIIDYETFSSAPEKLVNILLNKIDLVDVTLDLESGTEAVRNQIETLQNSSLFSKPGAPWIHWSLGNSETPRLATRLVYGNATLGATLLQLMLPGTPSLFYGDEIGLRDIFDPEGEREDVKHIHQLAVMAWATNEKQFTDRDVLPWMHGTPTSTAFSQRELITQMVKLRENSPAIYINSVVNENIRKANVEVKFSDQDILIIQRWYPRRNSFVVISNFGADKFSADLSTIFYSGKVAVGPRVDSTHKSVSFKSISLWPGESVVIELY